MSLLLIMGHVGWVIECRGISLHQFISVFWIFWLGFTSLVDAAPTRIVRVIRVILLDAFLKTTFFVSSLSRKQINKDFHSLRKEDAFVACVKVESSS